MDVLVSLGTSCAYFYSVSGRFHVFYFSEFVNLQVLAIIVGLANPVFRANKVSFSLPDCFCFHDSI